MDNLAEYYIRRATVEDAPEIYECMEHAYQFLEDKSLFVLDSEEFIRKQICEEGFAVVACNSSEEIVASLIIRYPKEASDNLGYDIGLTNDELGHVAHIEAAVVDREFRGKGIQGKLLDYAEQEISQSCYCFLMATVSPNNPASKKTFLNRGYKVLLTKEKYAGMKRDILLKTIDK